MKKIVFCLVLILTLIFFGKNLNPFSDNMFNFHDMTQPARIQQFTLNLQNFKIPPRLAPDFSFRLGYPVFNFYAPTSYWISGLIHLTRIDIVNTLKISFLLALIVAFCGSYLLLANFFTWMTALLGGILYISSLYIPLSIFVRGNLGELWFIALFPLTLHFLYRNSQNKSKHIFLLTILVMFFTFTAHNLLSLVSIPICFIWIWFQKNKKKNIIALITSLLLGSYFFLPLIFENSLTYAKEVAKLTNYSDHFLCWWQLWQSPWGFGGSAPGCINDGMSFKIGKPQVILALLGLGTLLYYVFKHKKYKWLVISLFFLLLTLGTLFMTTYQSQFIWSALSPLFSLFQFPWRFIAFSLVGIAFLASIFINTIKIPYKSFGILFIIVLLLITTSRYFYKSSMTKNNFNKTYLTQEYLEQKVAYAIAEYLPKTASYTYWRSSEKTGLSFDYSLPAESTPSAIQTLISQPFEKEFFVNPPTTVMLNIHYFPFWKIIVNNVLVRPARFDRLGRPIFTINEPSTIRLVYDETPIEKVADIITILSFIMILVSVANKKIWNRINT